MLVQLAAFMLAAPIPQAAPPTFKVVFLEAPEGAFAYPFEINAKGEIVGRLEKQWRSTPAHWDEEGALTVLAPPQVERGFYASGINDSGVIVGTIHHGPYRGMPVVQTPADGLQPVQWPLSAWALDINSAGDVLLKYGPSNSVVIGRDGQVQRIPHPGIFPIGMALSDDGFVAGFGYKGGKYVPFRWSEPGGYEELAAPISGTVTAIANDGVVAGALSGWGGSQAALWDAAGNARMLPFSLVPPSYGALHSSVALDLNDAGWVVGNQQGLSSSGTYGNHGTLWIDGQPFELNELLVNPSPRILIFEAYGVNAAGQIACVGWVRDEMRGMRLDPL